MMPPSRTVGFVYFLMECWSFCPRFQPSSACCQELLAGKNVSEKLVFVLEGDQKRVVMRCHSSTVN